MYYFCVHKPGFLMLGHIRINIRYTESSVYGQYNTFHAYDYRNNRKSVVVKVRIILTPTIQHFKTIIGPK